MRFLEISSSDFHAQILSLAKQSSVAIKRCNRIRSQYNPFSEFALSAKNCFILALPATLCLFWKLCSSAVLSVSFRFLRVQLEFCRLTNMSVAAIADIGPLSLEADLLDLTSFKRGQEERRAFYPLHGSTGHFQDVLGIRDRGNTHVGQTANFKLNSHFRGQVLLFLVANLWC